MRPLRPACGTVSNAQLLTLPPIIRIIAPGEVTTQLSSLPPASSKATDVLGSSERRLATAQPPEPPPTTTKSNVSVMVHPPEAFVARRIGRLFILDTTLGGRGGSRAPAWNVIAQPSVKGGSEGALSEASPGLVHRASAGPLVPQAGVSRSFRQIRARGRIWRTKYALCCHKILKSRLLALSKAGSHWYIPFAPNGIRPGCLLRKPPDRFDRRPRAWAKSVSASVFEKA